MKFELESTGDRPVLLPRDAAVRLICHGFLERLPSEALYDVWENIHDAWEWHMRPVPTVPKLENPTVVLGVFDPVEAKPFRLTEE